MLADEEEAGRMLKALAAIESGLAGPLTVAGLARIACYSEFHFLRKFKERCGRGPHAYIRLRRLSEASRLLLETRWDTDRVAWETGYGSGRVLNRPFAERFGMGMAAYRDGRADLWYRRFAALSEAEYLHRNGGGVSLLPEFADAPARLLAGYWREHAMASSGLDDLYRSLRACGWIRKAVLPFLRCYAWTTPYQLRERKHHVGFFLPPPLGLRASGASLKAFPAMRQACFRHRGSMDAYRWSQRHIWQDWFRSAGCGHREADPVELRFPYPEGELAWKDFEVRIPVEARDAVIAQDGKGSFGAAVASSAA